MRLKNRFLHTSVTLFLLYALHPCLVLAQSNGSFYLSAGYNESWFSKSDIHIEQGDLNNSYDILKAPGNNKTNTPIGLLHLNYRLGYYFDHYQENGMEANFDPVNYQVADGKTVHIHGTVNNLLNTDKNIAFSAKNGFYYRFTGANLLLLNYVHRFELYRPTSKKIGVDILGKIGAGPVYPHADNELDGNASAGKTFAFGGWNAGAEVALRGTFYRYIYAEIAGKYDYAAFNSLAVHDGTARQNLHIYEVIGSIGFTFPTTKRNPLFYIEHKIVTILPLFLLKDGKSEKDGDEASGKHHKKGEGEEADTLNGKDIPEFQSVLDKKKRRLDKMRIDSLTRATGMSSEDSLMNSIPVDLTSRDSLVRDSLLRDSLQKANPEEGHKKHKRRKKHKEDQAAADSTAKQPTVAPTDAPPNVDSLLNSSQAAPPTTEPAAPKTEAKDTTATPELSKKERKKLEKEKRRLEKEAEKKKKEEEQVTIPDTPPPADTTKKDGQ